MKKNKKNNTITECPVNQKAPECESELRQDIITGDWVVIATGRARRPDEFGKFERIKDDAGIEKCLFEDPEKSGQKPDVLIYRKSNGDWSLRVFPNKYPAFSQVEHPCEFGEGPHFSMPGVGSHEVIVTRDHFRQAALMDVMEVAEIFDKTKTPKIRRNSRWNSFETSGIQ